MKDYEVTFNKSINFQAAQLTKIEKFLDNASIKTNFDGNSKAWKVSTTKKLTLSLMNSALNSAGIHDVNTVGVKEIKELL